MSRSDPRLPRAIASVGVLFDLGVSSHQLDEAGRGFSYRRPGPARHADGVDVWRGTRLAFCSRSGQPCRPRRARRHHPPLRRRAVRPADRRRHRGRPPDRRHRPPGRSRGRGGPGTGPAPSATPPVARFQAIRIAVNDELDALARRPRRRHRRRGGGGRIVVIAYHSLEDRIVKRRFAAGSRGCVCPPELPVCVCDSTAELRLLTRKPLRPGLEEIGGQPAGPQCAAPRGGEDRRDDHPHRIGPGHPRTRSIAAAPSRPAAARQRPPAAPARGSSFTVVVLVAFFGLIASRISLDQSAFTVDRLEDEIAAEQTRSTWRSSCGSPSCATRTASPTRAAAMGMAFPSRQLAARGRPVGPSGASGSAAGGPGCRSRSGPGHDQERRPHGPPHGEAGDRGGQPARRAAECRSARPAPATSGCCWSPLAWSSPGSGSAIGWSQVQAFDAEQWSISRGRAGLHNEALPAPRGTIYDRDGVELAVTVEAVTIVADPTPGGTGRARTARLLAPVLDLDAAELDRAPLRRRTLHLRRQGAPRRRSPMSRSASSTEHELTGLDLP